MLRRNGPVVKTVESVLRLEGSPWWETPREHQGRWLVWVRRNRPPIFGPGDTITSVPHHLMSQVKLSLFLDFAAFYFTKTHNYFTLMMTKKLQLLGNGCALVPRWGTSVPSLPAILLCPPNYGDRSTPILGNTPNILSGTRGVPKGV